MTQPNTNNSDKTGASATPKLAKTALSKQADNLNNETGSILGLDDDGVVWRLTDKGQFGYRWLRKIGSPNNPNVANPPEVSGQPVIDNEAEWLVQDCPTQQRGLGR